jgi:hypothetical protein
MAMLQASSSKTRLRSLLMSFARLAAAEGQMETAARLLGCFHALNENTPGENPDKNDVPTRYTWQSREAVLARGVLGEVAFATAWEQGCVLTLQEALDEALHV